MIKLLSSIFKCKENYENLFNIFSEQDCVLIIRTILSKSKRLMNIIEIYNETKDLDKAIMSAKPPVFWKDKISVKKQAKTWVLSELKNKIY